LLISVAFEDDQKTNCGTVCKPILIDVKLKNWKKISQNRADWEKLTKEAKIRTGLWCHLRGKKKNKKKCTMMLPELV
jgi:hypothetical protein